MHQIHFAVQNMQNISLKDVHIHLHTETYSNLQTITTELPDLDEDLDLVEVVHHVGVVLPRAEHLAVRHVGEEGGRLVLLGVGRLPVRALDHVRHVEQEVLALFFRLRRSRRRRRFIVIVLLLVQVVELVLVFGGRRGRVVEVDGNQRPVADLHEGGVRRLLKGAVEL